MPTDPSATDHAAHFNDLLGDDLQGGFLDHALKTAHLDRPLTFGPDDPGLRRAALHAGLRVTSLDSHILAVNLTWDRPEECARIATALRTEYIQEARAERQASLVAATYFLDSELRMYRARLHALDTTPAVLPSRGTPRQTERAAESPELRTPLRAVLLAQAQTILLQEERLKVGNDLQRTGGSPGLVPVGMVFAQPVESGFWGEPWPWWSLAAVLLVVWVALLVRQRAFGRR